MALSLRPTSFSEGGSLLDDVDATVTRARFEMYDYGGKSERGPAPALMLVLQEGDGTESVQYYSAGNADYFAPSQDEKNADLNGITLEALGEKSSMNGGCNAALLLNSLVQAGFPEDKLDEGDLRVLEGLVAHWNRVPQPKRSNIAKKEGARDPMILICTAIKSLPGESKAKAAGGAAKTTKADPKPAESTDLPDELAMEIIGLFAEKGVTSMKKIEITQGLFKSLAKDNPNKQKLMSIATKDDVLKKLDGFSFNGSILTQK